MDTIVATSDGKSGLALLLTGSIEDRPAYCAIGSGSGGYQEIKSLDEGGTLYPTPDGEYEKKLEIFERQQLSLGERMKLAFESAGEGAEVRGGIRCGSLLE